MNIQQAIDKFIGKKIKDKVSGMSGVVVSVTYFLNGCIRLSIQPPIDKDGKMRDERWFDIQQIELVEKPAEKPVEVERSATGGPQTSLTPSMR